MRARVEKRSLLGWDKSKDKILGIIGMEEQGICVELITDSVATDWNFPAPSLVDYKQRQSKK